MAGIYTCPSCHFASTSQLDKAILLVCENCHDFVFLNLDNIDKPQRSIVPLDWSFIKLKTTGEYDKPFTVVGRIRIQLRNDYKNFWCCTFTNGSYMWLMESFASLAILNPSWELFKRDVHALKSGSDVTLNKELRITGEYVEKCEGICYEGEIGDWKNFRPGFFFIQASNNANDTAVFTFDKDNQRIEYLMGKKVEVENLNLKDIIVWNDWL